MKQSFNHGKDFDNHLIAGDFNFDSKLNKEE